MFHAEKMKPQDYRFAVELANTLDWDMADIDFEYMSMLEPNGCFVLWQGHERVGMATCINYQKMGWFGNLAIRPKFRRKGAGTCLVKHAVQYLKNQGVEAIGLYAYQHLIGFYGKIGFKPLDDFVVLKGTIPETKPIADAFPKAIMKDIPGLTDLDSYCMGWSRKRLLESVLREEGNLCYRHAERGEIQGFVMVKVYGEMAEVGPLVCGRDRRHVAIELIENTLAEIGGLEIYAYVPLKETEILGLFQKAGLKEKFRVTRMFLGPVGAESCVYMPESLERG